MFCGLFRFGWVDDDDAAAAGILCKNAGGGGDMNQLQSKVKYRIQVLQLRSFARSLFSCVAF